jgi:hypothetical protein
MLHEDLSHDGIPANVTLMKVLMLIDALMEKPGILVDSQRVHGIRRTVQETLSSMESQNLLSSTVVEQLSKMTFVRSNYHSMQILLLLCITCVNMSSFARKAAKMEASSQELEEEFYCDICAGRCFLAGDYGFGSDVDVYRQTMISKYMIGINRIIMRLLLNPDPDPDPDYILGVTRKTVDGSFQYFLKTKLNDIPIPGAMGEALYQEEDTGETTIKPDAKTIRKILLTFPKLCPWRLIGNRKTQRQPSVTN